MHPQSLHALLKTVALLVILIMLVSLAYAGYISVWHWSGIGV